MPSSRETPGINKTAGVEFGVHGSLGVAETYYKRAAAHKNMYIFQL
jgi:hypothetical protein